MLFLTPGLKDLADFLPASLATIVSYFSAEVTRGVWKPAFMNGTDWPSPAANLQNVEEQIKKILAETGVDVPSLTTGFLHIILNSKNFFIILTYNAFFGNATELNLHLYFIFYTA